MSQLCAVAIGYHLKPPADIGTLWGYFELNPLTELDKNKRIEIGGADRITGKK